MSDLPAEKVVAELRALAPNMPEGPWRYEPWHVSEGPPMVFVKEGWLLCGLPADDHARWIALCSPDKITALLDLIAHQAARLEEEVGARKTAEHGGDLLADDNAKLKAALTAAEAEKERLANEITGLRAELQSVRAEKERLRRLPVIADYIDVQTRAREVMDALRKFADFKNCTAADVYRARELTGLLHLNAQDNFASPSTQNIRKILSEDGQHASARQEHHENQSSTGDPANG